MKAHTRIKSLQSLDAGITPEARAKRLRRLRNLANLTRQQVCEDESLAINLNTYKGWEIGRYGGLTRKGAERALIRFAREGVICTLDWLYYGVGTGPRVQIEMPDDMLCSVELAEKEAILAPLKSRRAEALDVTVDPVEVCRSQTAECIEALPLPPALFASSTNIGRWKDHIVEELVVFRRHVRHSVDLIVEDDGMLPHYQIGDYVAGSRRFGAEALSLLNSDCIVQTEDGFRLLRRIRPSNRPGCVTLVCTNPDTSVMHPILYHVRLLSAAPVIWQRKKDPS